MCRVDRHPFFSLRTCSRPRIFSSHLFYCVVFEGFVSTRCAWHVWYRTWYCDFPSFSRAVSQGLNSCIGGLLVPGIIIRFARNGGGSTKRRPSSNFQPGWSSWRLWQVLIHILLVSRILTLGGGMFSSIMPLSIAEG